MLSNYPDNSPFWEKGVADARRVSDGVFTYPQNLLLTESINLWLYFFTLFFCLSTLQTPRQLKLPPLFRCA